MSVSIGNRLPKAALAMLDGEEAREHLGKVILLLTVDEAGFPHVALLSPGEILAPGDDIFRLALYEDGRTLRNIAGRSKLALAIIEPGLCCYVKGAGSVTGTRIPPGPSQPFTAVRVDVEVEEVLLDSEVGASIETGARYSRSVAHDEELAQWGCVWEVLRGR